LEGSGKGGNLGRMGKKGGREGRVGKGGSVGHSFIGAAKFIDRRNFVGACCRVKQHGSDGWQREGA